MACGTPAIAFNRGAAPEVIQDGETGFIVPRDNLEALAKAIKNVDRIDRKEYRQRVEENFTVDKMVEGYERVYKELLERSGSDC